jgi:hypothetical protein
VYADGVGVIEGGRDVSVRVGGVKRWNSEGVVGIWRE